VGVTDSPAVGDGDDFAALFHAERRALLRFAYVMCGDGDLAEELVAEAFARTYPKWKRGRVDNPAAYLRRVVVNLVRGSFRRRAIERQPRPLGARDSAESPAADAHIGDPDALRIALDALGPRQRAAVVLRFLEDRSEAETASILGVDVGTVKSQVSRALAHLRRTLGETVEGGSA